VRERETKAKAKMKLVYDKKAKPRIVMAVEEEGEEWLVWQEADGSVWQ
jgi:hypothetical protein